MKDALRFSPRSRCHNQAGFPRWGVMVTAGGSWSVAAKTFAVFDSNEFEGWSTNQCFLSVGPVSLSRTCGPPGGGYLGAGPGWGGGFAWDCTYTSVLKDICPECDK